MDHFVARTWLIRGWFFFRGGLGYVKLDGSFRKTRAPDWMVE